MNKPENTSNNKLKYRGLIILVSVLIPAVVVVLLFVRIESIPPLTFLPPIYATINGLTALLLILAYRSILKKNVKRHELLMKVSIGLSVLFLVMYVLYHMTTDPTPFGGEGFIRYVYFFILITHITLSVFIIPMVLVSYSRAFQSKFASHKKIAKVTFPVWLYVAVTGVIVYLMISPYYS